MARFSLNSNSRFYKQPVSHLRISRIWKLSEVDILIIRYPKFRFILFEILLLYYVYILKKIRRFKILYVQHNEIQYKFTVFRKISSSVFTQIISIISDDIYTIYPTQSLSNSRKFKCALFNKPIPFKEALTPQNTDVIFDNIRIIFISTLPLNKKLKSLFKRTNVQYSLITNKEYYRPIKSKNDLIQKPLFIGGIKALHNKGAHNIVFIPHSNGSHATLFYHALYYEYPIILLQNKYINAYEIVLELNGGLVVQNDFELEAAIQVISSNYDSYKQNMKLIRERIERNAIEL